MTLAELERKSVLLLGFAAEQGLGFLRLVLAYQVEEVLVLVPIFVPLLLERGQQAAVFLGGMIWMLRAMLRKKENLEPRMNTDEHG